MTKTFLIIACVLSLIKYEASSQNLIAVQNGGNPTFYTQIDSALVHAMNGDTIYLPGGNFTINDTINKRIHLIGAGHHSDSANVTSRTLISGWNQLILGIGADQGSVTGIYFLDPGYESYPNIRIITDITGYIISRCNISKGIGQYSGISTNFIIKENIIGRSAWLSGSNNYFLNNIILGVVNLIGSTIRNNVFTLTQPGYANYGFCGNVCIVENNIFQSGYDYLCGEPNIYYNNVNVGVNGLSGTNQGNSNFLDNAPLQSILMNYDPATFTGEGLYDADFHLIDASPYKNAGRDGTDIGIYGGTHPWKDGSIPFNPHFQTAQIAPTTDSTGNLNVNIKVAAQDR